MSQHGDTCGCCTGLQARTPAEVVNAPGLKAIAYRAGTWESFRETMLSQFAMTRTKAGDALDAHSGQNFAVSLADAWAVVGDILTFYQERIANESYLRTATERRSVLELARMIGYELKPGVAAETWLAFTIDDPPVLPATGKTAVASIPLPVRRDAKLDAGLKVQSLPGPDEKPQLFETVEGTTAWPEWNAIPLRVRQPQLAGKFTLTIYLTGEIDLKAGELLLIEDGAHLPYLRHVVSAEYDAVTKITAVTLDKVDAGAPPVQGPATYEDLTVTPLARQKMPLSGSVLASLVVTNGPNIERAWHAEDLLTVAGFQGWDVDELAAAIYRYAQRDLTTLSHTKVFRFRLRAGVFGHNAPDPATFPPEKPPHDPPYPDPGTKTLANEAVPAKTVHLDATYPDIARQTWAVLQWETATKVEEGAYRITDLRQLALAKYFIAAKVTRLTLDSDASFGDMKLRTTTVFAQTASLQIGTEPVTAPVSDVVTNASRKGLRLDGVYLRMHAGQKVIITGTRVDLPGQTGHEQRTLTEVRIQSGLTTIYFDSPLTYDYDWTTVTVNGNVLRATHGESTKETLGSGNAATPYQRFPLRQKPLTYTGSSGVSGSESSLKVFVNDVQWHEQEMLYGHAPTERIFTAKRDDDGTTTVQFGDGITGARVPTGAENVRAEYRKGIGLEGLVHADQLTLLLSRPLGAKGVTNPLPSVDAADPEPRDEARRNAPLQVLTLGRAVSLRDFEDFARGFAGVAKSLATRISGREKPGVFVTVAGANGAAFTRTSDLATALRTFGDPFVPIEVKTFHSVLFRIEATVKIDPDHIPAVVQKAIEAALRERYSFEAQAFGQPVFLSEAIAVIQSVEGVVSATVKLLDPNGVEKTAIPAVVPFGDVVETTNGAELLTLDPRPVTLTVTT